MSYYIDAVIVNSLLHYTKPYQLIHSINKKMFNSLKLINLYLKINHKNMEYSLSQLFYFSGKILVIILLRSNNKELNKISRLLYKEQRKSIKIKFQTYFRCLLTREYKKKL